MEDRKSVGLAASLKDFLETNEATFEKKAKIRAKSVFMNQNLGEKLEFLDRRVGNLDSSILTLNKVYTDKLSSAKF